MQSRSLPPLRPAMAGLLVLTLFAPLGRAQIGGTSGVTELLSHNWKGHQALDHCRAPSVSEDGRYVAFETYASLLPVDTNATQDIYVLDRATGVLVCASTTAFGVYGDNLSRAAFLSADGRWVVFVSLAENLQGLDFNADWDVFRKDLQTGELVRVSDAYLSPEASNAGSDYPSISDDGRYVAFPSESSDLIPNDTNGVIDLFVRDMDTGLTERVSDGVWGQSNGNATRGMISGDGTHVTFSSLANNLILADANGVSDVFVKQLGSNPTLASRTPMGLPGNGFSYVPTISTDGSRVAYTSSAADLVATDINGVSDVFVFDVPTLTNTRVSVTSDGSEVAGLSSSASLSRDGQVVAFYSLGAIAPLSSPLGGVFVHDLQTGGSWTASLPSGATLVANEESTRPALALGGSAVVFDSEASNLVDDDTNAFNDIFVRTLHPDPFTYCSSPPTIQDCRPQLVSSGYSSASGADFFFLIGDDLPNQRAGLLFYGFEGPTANPWAGSTMCVAGVKRRTPLMTTGGLPLPANDCTGFFAFDMNSYAAGLLGGNPRPELSIVGQVVNAQFWGREGPTGTYLTTAVQYVVGP